MRSLQRVLAAAAGTLAAVGLVALPAASSPATPAGDGLDAIHRALVEDGTPHLHPRLANGPGVARGRRGGITPLSVESDSHGRTTVFVDGADKAALKRAVDSVGGTVTGSIDGTVRADVPTSALHTLALRAGVDTVRPQEKLVADAVTSEGVAKAGADAWQSVGTGAGVKVGVVDLGFGGLADAQASGDLPPTGPALSVTAEAGCTDVNADTHGTAVTEIVHDMAPDAQLVLVCVADNIDVAAAADFLQQQGVSVVNMSLSDPEALARGDGTGQLGDVIKKSRQQGLLWSIAAGNDGDHFFRGKATDHSGDGWVEFSGTDAFNNFQVAPDSVGALNLRWDAWPTTATEVDVVVMQSRRVPTGPDDPDLVAVLSADMTGKTRWNPQSGFFGFDNTGFADPWNLWVLVHNESAPQATQFDITIAGPVSALKYRTGGSIAEPANSPYAMAVGAVCVNSGTIEPYSSQGPTIDGRAKPDISASDGVSTTTFGPDSGGASCQDGFRGTSAAAPHAAGAAALVKSANPTFDAAQIQAYLETHATPTGTANQYGHGVLNMGPQQVPQAPTGDTYQPLASPTRVLDTRTTNGGHLGKLGSGEVVTLTVPGLPDDATAVAINLTGTNTVASTHLDVFPETYTGTSTLNLATGQTAAVFTMVALGPNHTIKIRNAGGAVDAIVDLLGTFVPTGGVTYLPKNPPARLLDTRTTTGGHLGKLSQGETFALQVRGVQGVPADATAVIVNVTGVNQTAATHVDLFPGDQPTGTSTLNLDRTSLRSNVTAATIGQDGKIRVHNFAGSLNVIVDLQGWFVPSGGSRFVALNPNTRIMDTRTGIGLHLGPLTAKQVMPLQGSEIYGVPYNATAIAFNLTVVSPTVQTFVTTWPAGLARPNTSNVNLLGGQVVPNAAVVGTGTNGQVSLYNDSGSAHLVADIYGYFVR